MDLNQKIYIINNDILQFLNNLDEKKLKKKDQKIKEDLVKRLREVNHEIDVEGAEVQDICEEEDTEEDTDDYDECSSGTSEDSVFNLDDSIVMMQTQGTSARIMMTQALMYGFVWTDESLISSGTRFWAVLTPQQLYLYQNAKSDLHNRVIGPLHGCRTLVHSRKPKKFRLTITRENKESLVINFCTEEAEKTKKWVSSIRKASTWKSRETKEERKSFATNKSERHEKMKISTEDHTIHSDRQDTSELEIIYKNKPNIEPRRRLYTLESKHNIPNLKVNKLNISKSMQSLTNQESQNEKFNKKNNSTDKMNRKYHSVDNQREEDNFQKQKKIILPKKSKSEQNIEMKTKVRERNRSNQNQVKHSKEESSQEDESHMGFKMKSSNKLQSPTYQLDSYKVRYDHVDQDGNCDDYQPTAFGRNFQTLQGGLSNKETIITLSGKPKLKPIIQPRQELTNKSGMKLKAPLPPSSKHA